MSRRRFAVASLLRLLVSTLVVIGNEKRHHQRADQQEYVHTHTQSANGNEPGPKRTIVCCHLGHVGYQVVPQPLCLSVGWSSLVVVVVVVLKHRRIAERVLALFYFFALPPICAHTRRPSCSLCTLGLVARGIHTTTATTHKNPSAQAPQHATRSRLVRAQSTATTCERQVALARRTVNICTRRWRPPSSPSSTTLE